MKKTRTSPVVSFDNRSPIRRRDFLAAVASAGVSGFLASCAAGPGFVRARAPFDLIIRNGTIIDGTGAPARIGDIGVRNRTIMAIGNLRSSDAERTIDAKGLVVAPGFIDIHSHVDLELFREPRAESKVRQGVTTEVTGMDGESVAPLGGPYLERHLKGFRERYGYECPYRDRDGFFAAMQKNGCAQNLISFVGLGTVRGVVVGMDDRPPSNEEMETMKREVLQAIDQGCWGVSTGLEYTPGSFASTEEIWEILKVVPPDRRVYASHIRNEDNRLIEAIEEAITIAKNADASLQVSHLKASYKINWPKQEKVLRMLDDGRAAGVNAHADRYTYTAYATDLAALFPLWAREGGTEKFLARLQDTTLLPKIREFVQKKINGLGSWDSILISGVRSQEGKAYQGRTIQQITSTGVADPFEFAVDLLLKEEGEVEMVGFGMDEAGTEMVLAWPYTMVASDAGSFSPSNATSRPHPRAYGTFPRAIAFYQRERNLVSLPEMIRKMTSLPAEKLGLSDRGTIAEGKSADIVVFDSLRIEDRATYIDPHQFPVGIPYVVVNGVLVVDSNVQTDALPGRVLRSS